MSRRNREDGSFATSDLFEPHTTINGAWRYHSRSDSQITLVTGKKFDPAPVEDAIRSRLDVVKDVLVVGNGKPEAGAIIIPAETGKSGKEIEEQIWSIVSEINEEGQSHTRIARGMIAIMPSGENGLGKSSKGTVLRRKAEERFAKDIEKLYGGGDIEDGEQAETEDEIRAAVRDIVKTVTGNREIHDDYDFYQFGVDSNQCTKIRNLLQRVGYSRCFFSYLC
jgi:long-subunit acyl-CoA synthetase (AMP-forming)